MKLKILKNSKNLYNQKNPSYMREISLLRGKNFLSVKDKSEFNRKRVDRMQNVY